MNTIEAPEEAAVAVKNEAVAVLPQQVNHEAAIRLLDEWMADETGYDERVWPIIEKSLKENSFSLRTRGGK